MTIGSGWPRWMARIFASEALARVAASAELGRAARAKRRLILDLALGRLNISPERPLTVPCFKAEIDATRWLVSDVTQEMVADRGSTTPLTLKATG